MLEPAHIVRLFTIMTHQFGHRWVSVYGGVVEKSGALSASARLWLEDLHACTPEQVTHAVNRIRQRRPEWPPGPLEFLDLCEGIPTLAELLDRRNDYGPICAEIRSRMDFYSLESMSTAQMIDAARLARERVITGMRRSGDMERAIGKYRLALAAPSGNYKIPTGES